jgi:16S rRNA (guanine527-N7)-methyltransferase
MFVGAPPSIDPLQGVSRETHRQLEILVETLERWQKAINLVGRKTLDGVWRRHIVDSAQIVPLIPAEAKTLADLGSGGGFPGLVIAAMRPELELTLIESDARKAAFLGEAARKMRLAKPPKLVIQRIEAAPATQAEVVTARALAPLDQLLAWSDRHRMDTAICLFHKGKGWQGEVDEAKKKWDFSPEAFASVTDRDAVLLRIGPYSAAADHRDRQSEGRRR